MNVKHFYAMFMLAALSPLIRLPALTAELGGRAAWVSIILACVIFYGLTKILGGDLHALYKSAFGKFISGLLAALYAAWSLGLAGYYLGMFAERFTGVVMPGVPPSFFTISLLGAVYIIISGHFRAFAIMCNLLFYIVFMAIGFTFLFQLPRIQPPNLFPVTQYDIPNILRASVPLLGVLGYITPLMFLAEDMKSAEKGKTALKIMGAGLMLFAVTVGVFGAQLTAGMKQPFLMSVKTVGTQGALERLESVFLLLWVAADIAIIVMFMHILLKILGKASEKFTSLYAKLILLCGVYFISLLEIPVRGGLYVNLVMGLALPALAAIINQIKAAFSRTLSKRGSPPTARAQP